MFDSIIAPESSNVSASGSSRVRSKVCSQKLAGNSVRLSRRKQKTIKILKESLRKNTLVALIISLISISFTFLENEFHYSSGESLATFILRGSVIILAIIQLILLSLYYNILFEIRKESKTIDKSTSFTQDPWTLHSYIADILINILVLPPFLDVEFKVHQLNTRSFLSLDDIFTVLSLLKFSHLLKYIYHHSAHNTEKGAFYIELQNSKFSILFALKAFIKEHSVVYLTLTTGFLVVISGVLLRIFERTIPNNAFSEVWTGVWIAEVTQTTIGYGDIVPVTHSGRAVCMISCFIGVWLYSSIVMVVADKTELNSQQVKLYVEILSLKMIDSESFGVLLIQRWWKLMQKRRRQLSRLRELRLFYSALREFQKDILTRGNFKGFALWHLIRDTRKHIKKGFENIKKELDCLDDLRSNSLVIVRQEYNVLQRIKRIRDTAATLAPFTAPVFRSPDMTSPSSFKGSCMQKKILMIKGKRSSQKRILDRVDKPSD